jgi:uncharacterized protein YdaU (DUF1376 family)
MHYYNFNIGDYIKHTMHLTVEEDITYRRLLDMYYDTESPIPTDIQWVSRRLRMPANFVESVLDEFFQLTEDGYRNYRADAEIAEYHTYIDKQRSNGKLGGRPKKSSGKPTANPSQTKAEPKKSLNNKQQTITNNQLKELEPQPKKSKGTRLDQSWALPDDWAIWAKEQRPDVNVNQTADGFKDYWLAIPGMKGVKADWFATWRNWVRNQRTNIDKIVLHEAPWQKAARLKAAEFSPRIAARDPKEQQNTIDNSIDIFTTPKEISNGNTDSSN